MDEVGNKKPKPSSTNSTPQSGKSEPEKQNQSPKSSDMNDSGFDEQQGSHHEGFKRSVFSADEKNPHISQPKRKETIFTKISFLLLHPFAAVIGRVASIINIGSTPISATGYFNRGSMYYRQGDLDHAISDFDQAIQRNPGYIEAYSYRGQAYSRKGDLDRAISDFDQAIQLNPEYVNGYDLRGLTYAERGDLDCAISDLNKALEIEPDNAQAYCDRGYVYICIGETQNAIEDFNIVLDLFDTDSDSCEYAEHMLREIKNPKSEGLRFDDLWFLVALNASEESFLYELRRDIEGRLSVFERDKALSLAREAIRDLLAKDIVALTRRNLSSHLDLDLQKVEALAAIGSDPEWGYPDKVQMESRCLLYLSPHGEEVWEKGPLNISQERAKFLMFEQSNDTTRRFKAGKSINKDNKQR